MNDKLKELYAKRKVFEDYNAEVPVDLRNEISWQEHILAENVIETIASYIPETIEKVAVDRLVFVAEYVDGKLVRFGSGNSELYQDELFGSYKSVDKEDLPDDDNTDESEEGVTRGPSIGFTVKFADGKVIKESTARSTMIEALKYMGLERASKFRSEMFKGFPLICKEKRITIPQRKWQKNVDGWWIYVNMGNPRAIACIKGVASMLNIPVEIIMDEDGIEPQPPIGKPKGRRAKYSLNGGEPAWKNRTVWNAVRNLLSELPNATFKEISDFFPKNLQGSYGVVATIADIEERSKRNKSEYNRWFLDPSDILTAGDGTKFTVTTEWGDNFVNFRNHVVSEFGWTIEEV